MSDLQSQIHTLQQRLQIIDKVERYQRDLERKRSDQQAKLDDLAQAMEKEHRELLDLERWSVKELFIKVVDKAAQLEREKEEYLQAAIAYQDAAREVELINFEIKVLQDKVAGRKEIATQLQQLFEEREAELLRQPGDHPLKTLLPELARYNQLERELTEAILHGTEVSLQLESVAQHLIRAKNWINNGLQEDHYAIRMITAEIDEARLRLPRLRLEIVKFERELQEVFHYPELDSWPHAPWQGLQQAQQLTADLSRFTQLLVQHGTTTRELPFQLHQTHTLADHLRHQADMGLKWLRLEKERIVQEVHRLQQGRRHLLQ